MLARCITLSRALIRKLLRVFDLNGNYTFERHLAKEDTQIIKLYYKYKPYTISSLEKMYSLYKAVQYITKLKILGDMVECGVWKGGSAMMMAAALLEMDEKKRTFYLYDTYAGMAKPKDNDIDFLGRPAIKKWGKNQKTNYNKWFYADLEETKLNLFSTMYPKEKINFVKGKVEDTIPKIMPEKISLLHLDTNWYESTYHELCYLFPRLSINGVIIIDNYDFSRGEREAVDKYFKENNINILLCPVGGETRIGIKVN